MKQSLILTKQVYTFLKNKYKFRIGYKAYNLFKCKLIMNNGATNAKYSMPFISENIVHE